MRTKHHLLDDLSRHANKLDPQHYELAAVAMIETEVQIDIRDRLTFIMTTLQAINKKVPELP